MPSSRSDFPPDRHPVARAIVAFSMPVVILLVATVFAVRTCRSVQHQNLIKRTEAHRHKIDSTADKADLATLRHYLNDARQKNDTPAQVILHRHLGQALRKASEFTLATEVHLEGYRLAQEQRDTIEMMQALNNLGTDYRRLDLLDQAAASYFKSLNLHDLHRHSMDAREVKCRTFALNGLGNVSLTLRNFAAADSSFRIALSLERQIGNHLGQAINLANLGTLHQEQQHYDSALHYYRQSLHQNRLIGDSAGIALCYARIGSLHEKTHQLHEAEEYYRNAIDLMHRHTDRSTVLSPMTGLARTLITRGALAEGRTLLDTTLHAAQRIGARIAQVEIYTTYAELARRSGNEHAALRAELTALLIRDSISGPTGRGRLMDLRLDYERKRAANLLTDVQQVLAREQRSKALIARTTGITILITLIALILILFVARQRLTTLRLQRQSIAERARFFTHITHEFRTPLTLIIGLTELLETKTNPPAAEVRNTNRRIAAQGRHLLTLVNQLLDIARAQSINTRPQWRRGAAIEFVRNIVEAHRPLALQRSISLTYHTYETEIRHDIVFCPDYLTKIVNNLVTNAIKFSADGGQVRVSFYVATDGSTRLMVADNGAGISEADRERIFQPFFTNSENSARPPLGTGMGTGTGIGLSLVSLLTRALHGTIEVESAEGRGTTFTLHFPPPQTGHQNIRPLTEANFSAMTQVLDPSANLTETLATDSEGKAAPPPPEPDTDYTILVIEDNRDIANFVTTLLSPLYRVLTAPDGASGLAAAERERPNLVLTDLMMPGIDGLQVCAALRDNPSLAHIPRLVLTARAGTDTRIAALRAGADDILLKPFSTDELLARVHQLLTRNKQFEQAAAAGLKSPQNAQTDNADNTKPAKELTAEARNFLTRLDAAIVRQLHAESFNVERLAAEVYLSSSQLRRRVQEYTGEKVSSYVLRIRMTEARRLLDKHPDMSIAEVAQRCGFYDLSHFSRQFKASYQITPSQYRRNPHL